MSSQVPAPEPPFLAWPDPRAERMARIRDLRKRREHPEQYPGVFSPTNLTRLALILVVTSLAASLVHAVLGRWAPAALSMLATAVAITVARHWFDRVWLRIGGVVLRFWQAVMLVGGAVAVSGFVLRTVAPASPILTAAGGAAGSWVDRQRAMLDARQRAQRIPVDATYESGDGWRLMADSGLVRLGTMHEAREWCSALGAGWGLPEGTSWPALASWPRLSRPVYAWTRSGMGAQIGSGGPPQAFVSGAPRESEVRAVMCLRGEEAHAPGH